MGETVPPLNHAVSGVSGEPLGPSAWMDLLLPCYLVDFDISDDPIDGILKLVSEVAGEKREMDAHFPTVDKNSIGEICPIGGSFSVAPFIQKQSDSVLAAFPLRNEHQIGEKVDIHYFIQHNRFVLRYVVPGSFVDNFSKSFVQLHQDDIFLLVLEGNVVLLVDLVVAFDGLFEGLVVGVLGWNFWRVVSEDEVIF